MSMINLKDKKQYGLIIPKQKKGQTKLVSRLSAFDDNNEEVDEEQNLPSYEPKSKIQQRIKKQTQIEIDKALSEDATVFDYDGIYEKLQDKKKEDMPAVTKQDVEKKPKYIEGLLKAARLRQREYEHHQERTVQKEREEEGDKFADKEAFVTPAYREKMERIQQELAEERQKDLLDAKMAVTKQQDLSAFYRHLLDTEHSVKTEKKEALTTTDVKSEAPATSPSETTPTTPLKAKPIKQYRRRRTTTESSSSEGESDSGQSETEENGVPMETEGPGIKAERRSESHDVEMDVKPPLANQDTAETAPTNHRLASDVSSIDQPIIKKEVEEVDWESRFVRKTSDVEIAAATERYLARKLTRTGPVIAREDDE